MAKLMSGELMSKNRQRHVDWRVEGVLEWMDHQIVHAEHSVNTLKRARERFKDNLKSNKNHDTIVSSVGWFVNDIKNIIRSYRETLYEEEETAE